MATKVEIKVADEVWVATALLHRERRGAIDFFVDEILERARREGITKELRPGVYVHIVQHCVANRAPNPGRYRMLLETAEGRRRLFRKGDSYHPDREGSKTVPESEDLPKEYQPLLDWYQEWTQATAGQQVERDPLLRLRGSGKKLWKSEPADEYVNRLREGWQ
ncbi:MAG TPA: hypothetical protein VJX70_02760 [Candidatus Acidoferrum sp.]|nr:hypothetical protein [Candidatus Acidoferrum sp.]